MFDHDRINILISPEDTPIAPGKDPDDAERPLEAPAGRPNDLPADVPQTPPNPNDPFPANDPVPHERTLR